MTIEVDFDDVFDDWLEKLKARSPQTSYSKRLDVEWFVERAIGALQSSDSAYILIKLLHKETPTARRLAIAELREDEVL